MTKFILLFLFLIVPSTYSMNNSKYYCEAELSKKDLDTLKSRFHFVGNFFSQKGYVHYNNNDCCWKVEKCKSARKVSFKRTFKAYKNKHLLIGTDEQYLLFSYRFFKNIVDRHENGFVFFYGDFLYDYYVKFDVSDLS